MIYSGNSCIEVDQFMDHNMVVAIPATARHESSGEKQVNSTRHFMPRAILWIALY